MNSVTTASGTAMRPTQPPIQWVPGALSLGVKRPGREADHSPPSTAEVKELVELYLHSPNTPSWGGAQLKHWDIFTFYFSRNSVHIHPVSCCLLLYFNTEIHRGYLTRHAAWTTITVDVSVKSTPNRHYICHYDGGGGGGDDNNNNNNNKAFSRFSKKTVLLRTSHIIRKVPETCAWVVGCTSGSRGEVPGERIRHDDKNKNMQLNTGISAYAYTYNTTRTWSAISYRLLEQRRKFSARIWIWCQDGTP
jgi:hypothetical protein